MFILLDTTLKCSNHLPCLSLQWHVSYYQRAPTRTIYHFEWLFGMVENTLWQGINSSFYPILLTGWRSLPLSAKWLFSLLFHPCFPPILHTRAWVRESDTSQERRVEGGESERDGRQTEEENKQRWRQLEGRETSWSISRRNKEPETIWSGPRFLEVQDAALNMANPSVHRWCRSPHHNSQLCNVLYSFAQFVCRIILLAASLRLSWLTQWCIIWHKTLPRVELKLRIT